MENYNSWTSEYVRNINNANNIKRVKLEVKRARNNVKNALKNGIIDYKVKERLNSELLYVIRIAKKRISKLK